MNIGNSFNFLRFSRKVVNFECKNSTSYTNLPLSCKYIFILVRSCEHFSRIGTNRNYDASILLREIDCCHDQLVGYTLPFKAFKDACMVDDHPFRGCALVGQFTYMNVVKPRLEKAISFRFCVFDAKHIIRS